MSKKKTKKALGAIALALALSLMTGHAIAGQASPPLTGAIFTTDANSNFVNANVYEDLADVYLNGGPRPNAPCTAAGLPSGPYYFQVTDPPGKVLLSTDPIANRRIEVLGGVITAVSVGRHFGIGKCPNSFTVELFPYSLTPNDGGEYKVWITRVADYDATTASVSPFGFIPSKSKTDNFKVLPCPDGTSFVEATGMCVVPPALPPPPEVPPPENPPTETPPPDVLM
jgi:hypothetical protein